MMSRRRGWVAALVALGLGGALGLGAQPPNSELRLRVSGLRSDRGAVVCGLFTESNWLRAGGVGASAKIRDGEAVCIYRDVKPGTYAISAYHDENDNGRLDSNFIRIPKEGTAASNGARGKFGPPKFKDARFEYQGDVLELTDIMQYRK